MIGKVISEKDEQDRYCMLVHAIAFARLASHLRMLESTTRPFVVAICLTAGMIAERYIVMKAESGAKVWTMFPAKVLHLY